MIDKNVIEKSSTKIKDWQLIQLILASPYEPATKLVLIFCLGKYRADYTFSSKNVAKNTHLTQRTVQLAMKQLQADRVLKFVKYIETPTNKCPVFGFNLNALLAKLNSEINSSFNEPNGALNSEVNSEPNSEPNSEINSTTKEDSTKIDSTKKDSTKKNGTGVHSSGKAGMLKNGTTQALGLGVSSSSLQSGVAVPIDSVKESVCLDLVTSDLAKPLPVSSKLKNNGTTSTSTSTATANVPINPFIGYKADGFISKVNLNRLRSNFARKEFDQLNNQELVSLVVETSEEYNEPIPANVKEYLKI